MPTHGVIDTTEIRQRERLTSPACLKSVAFAMHLPDWLNNTGRLLARAAAQMLLATCRTGRLFAAAPWPAATADVATDRKAARAR